MRDILLVFFLFIAIYYSFKKPSIGVAAWMWIALMAPAKWTFGFSNSFRLNVAIVIITTLSYIMWKEKPKFKFTKLHFCFFLFLFWMWISTIVHLQINSDIVWNKYLEFLKIFALFMFITLTIRTKKDIDVLVWSIVLSISAYGAMEATKFIISGGGHRIVGRSGIIADRNDLAVAINMCIPLVLYLWSVTKNPRLKLALLALGALNIIAIIGTYSRGGFIGLLILAFAMWLSSQRKMVYVLVAVIVLPTLYINAPTEWKERQSTIETASSKDGSFIGRLWAWKIATLIALDNPLTGGGFNATSDPVLWNAYASDTPSFGPIETPEIPINIKPKAAHNIYFQVLASAGFVGLFLFLFLLSSSYFTIRKCAKEASKMNIAWQKNISNAISLSLVGYGITGLNVSLAYFELVYALIALTSVIKVMNEEDENKPNYLETIPQRSIS